MPNLLQLAALASLQLHRKLYLSAIGVAVAAGVRPETVVTDVCDMAREAGALLGDA